MGSVRFVDILYEAKDGLPQLFELDPSIYGRTPSNLLDEAIRFYNYPAAGLYATATAWQVFRNDHVNKAILLLHDVLKEGIVTMVGNLYKDILGHLDKKKCGNVGGYHSELGSMCAELLVSPKCRSQEKLKMLERSPNLVHFREFERLMESLGLLRTWGERIENIYQERYSNLIGGSESEIRQALFEPAWGGSWIVKPNEYLWKTRDRIWNPENPIWPYAPGNVGPTEKLYFSLLSGVFKRQHNIPFSQSRNHFGQTKDPFLQRVYQQSKTIKQIMPSYEPKNKRIIVWNLGREILSTSLISLKKQYLKSNTSLGRRKEEEWTSWIKRNGCGVRVGLPAALGLIGILYAYITDLQARTLMAALSSAIIDIYEKINGYTAVGLCEALSRKGAIATVGDQTVLEKELVGILRQWRTFPAAEVQELNPWGDAKVDKSVRECLSSF